MLVCMPLCKHIQHAAESCNSNSSHSLLFGLLFNRVGQPDYETHLRKNQCLTLSNQNAVLNASVLSTFHHIYLFIVGVGAVLCCAVCSTRVSILRKHPTVCRSDWRW